MHVRSYLIDLAAAAEPLERAEAQLGLLDADGPIGGDRRYARIALRLALRIEGGDQLARCALLIAPGGKPALPGADVQFSVSHTAGLALVGVCHAAPIGVDIEASRTVAIAPPRRVGILAAGRRLSRLPLRGDTEDAQLLCAWTRIEAVAKAGGVGALAMLAWLGARGSAAPELRRYALGEAGDLQLDGTGYVVSPVPGASSSFASVCHPRAYTLAAPLGLDALLAAPIRR
jgi:4'-phosphopantetheinyl transferase